MTDIALGGRLFAPANFDRMTSLQECNVMRLLRASGLDRIMPAQDDSEAAWLAKLNAAVVDCGHLHELIGAFLLPIGKTERDWTPQLSGETKGFLEQLDTPEDRETVHKLGMEVTVGFFMHGVASLRRSENALRGIESSTTQSLLRRTPPNVTPAAASTPAPGRRSFGLSLGSIFRRPKKLPAGRSASS